MKIGWNVLVRQFRLQQAECEETALRVLMREGTCLRNFDVCSSEIIWQSPQVFLYGCFNEAV